MRPSLAQILRQNREMGFDFNDMQRWGTALFGNIKISPPRLYPTKLRNDAVRGEYLSSVGVGNVEAVIPFHLEASTSDQMMQQMERLNRVLEDGGWFKYRPAGGTDDATRIYTFEQAETVSLWDGRDYNIQLVEYAHSISYLYCLLDCLPDPEGTEEMVDLAAPVIL